MANFSAVTWICICIVYYMLNTTLSDNADCDIPYGTINYWALDNQNTLNNHDLDYCLVVMDLETYELTHPNINDREIVEPLQGRVPAFSCTVEALSDCLNTSAVLKIGSSSTCASSANGMSIASLSSIFDVRNIDNVTCTNMTCMTFVEVELQFTNQNQTERVPFVQTSDIGHMNNVYANFSNLTLRYQTCMSEILKFQIPMSANVPLSVSCSSYDGGPLLHNMCLADEPTTTEYDNDGMGTTVRTDGTDSSEEDRKSKEKQMFLLSSTVIYIIIGSGCFIVLFIVIVGAVVITRRRRRKKRDCKADDETPNVNVTMVQGTNNRVSYSKTYQEIGDVPGTNNEPLQQALDEQEQQQAESSTVDGFGGGFADIGSFKPHGSAQSEDIAKGNNNESERVDDVKQPQLSSEEIENLYAKPIKDRPTLVENDMYESSGTHPTTRETQSSTLEQPEVPVKTQEGDVPDPGGEYSCIKDAL